MSNLQRKRFRGALAAILAAVAVLDFKNFLLVSHSWFFLAAGIITTIGAVLNLLYALNEKTDD